jgi:hypothetical protein
MKEETQKAILFSAVILGGTGIFLGVDYMQSKAPNRNTIRVNANVEQVHEDVYVPFGERGRFVTKKKSLAGKLGTFAKDTIGLGNTNAGYIVTPTKVTYTTQGGLFFNPKEIEKTTNSSFLSNNDNNLAIISQVKLENVLNNSVQYHPYSDLTTGELLMKGRAKSFSITSGDNQKTYDTVIYNPKHFEKIE